MPSDERNPAQLRLQPGRLACSDEHHDRPLREPQGAGRDPGLPRGELPAEHRAGRQARSRPPPGRVQGMAGADARPAFPRPGRGSRRLDLVGRAMGQPDRPHRPEDGGDEGIPAAAERFASHGDHRSRRKRLVHRQQERHRRQVRREDRTDHRIQDAGSDGQGPGTRRPSTPRAGSGSACRRAT